MMRQILQLEVRQGCGDNDYRVEASVNRLAPSSEYATTTPKVQGQRAIVLLPLRKSFNARIAQYVSCSSSRPFPGFFIGLVHPQILAGRFSEDSYSMSNVLIHSNSTEEEEQQE